MGLRHCADHVICNSFPMICSSPLDGYICDNFLATEHDKLAMDCSFDSINTTLFCLDSSSLLNVMRLLLSLELCQTTWLQLQKYRIVESSLDRTLYGIFQADAISLQIFCLSILISSLMSYPE